MLYVIDSGVCVVNVFTFVWFGRACVGDEIR